MKEFLAMGLAMMIAFVVLMPASSTPIDLSGKWKMTAIKAINFDLDIQQNEKQITDTMTRKNGVEPLDGIIGTISSDGTIHFTCARAGVWTQVYDGQVSGSSGSIRMMGIFSQDGTRQYPWNPTPTIDTGKNILASHSNIIGTYKPIPLKANTSTSSRESDLAGSIDLIQNTLRESYLNASNDLHNMPSKVKYFNPLLLINWTGRWDTDLGHMTLQQSGKNVSGSCMNENRPFRIIWGNASGNWLNGSWADRGSKKGTFEFVLSDDSKSFRGHWRYGLSGSWSGEWNGKRQI